MGAADLFGNAVDVERGFDAVIGGNVPPGAGISSSAAVEVALLNALRAAFGVDLGDLALVLMAQRIEHDYLGVQTGLMDQYTSQFARPGKLMLVDFDQVGHDQVEAALNGWVWLLLDSLVRHDLADSAYGERVEQMLTALRMVSAADEGVASFRHLTATHVDAIEDPVLRRRARHYVAENERVRRAAAAVSAGDAATAGALLLQSHASLRDDYEVSCDELDALVDAAAPLDGCAGARMMGGGFGGCTLNLVREDAVEQVVASVRSGFEANFGYAPDDAVYRLVGGARVHADAEQP
jgi:galactokinase